MLEVKQKILIADSAPLYREGIKIALSAEQHKAEPKIYETDSVSSVIELADRIEPLDLLLLDAALLAKKKGCPLKTFIANTSIPVILMCNQLNSSALLQARALGIQGILCKSDELSKVHQGIAKVLSGAELWPDECAVDRLKQARNQQTLQYGICHLTDAQKIVLAYLRRGLLNKQIGYELGIQENTVKCHVSRIFSKLRVSNRTELIIAMQGSFPLEKV